MPRLGLTTQKVVEAAAVLVDEQGLDRLSLSGVARRFGVADPSLYTHVSGLADLRSKVAHLARAELAERLGSAVEGRSGRDALAAYAAAYRGYARERPGRMAAVEEPPAPAAGDGGDGARIVRATYAAFGAYELVEPDLTDAVRFVRSTLHGFTDLERRAHFHDPAPVEASFSRLVDALDAALTHWPARPSAPPVVVTHHRLEVVDASIPYELRGAGPLLVLVGGPVTRAGYARLAEALAEDHTVLTYDPRGFGESERRDHGDLAPAALADDLATLLDTLGTGPAHVVGCSGGAVTALNLAIRRPDLVTAVLAHEPPLVRLIDDEGLLDRVAAVRETYRAHGARAAQRHLDALVSGEEPGDDIAPDGPAEHTRAEAGETGHTDRDLAAFMGDLLVPTLTSTTDIGALADIPDLVVAAGAESSAELPHRCAEALAARTDRPLLTVPGGHVAAITDPAGFADAIRRARSTAEWCPAGWCTTPSTA